MMHNGGIQNEKPNNKSEIKFDPGLFECLRYEREYAGERRGCVALLCVLFVPGSSNRPVVHSHVCVVRPDLEMEALVLLFLRLTQM